MATIICALLAFSAGTSRADIWEFDRSGNVLRAPDRPETRTDDETARAELPTLSSRSAYSAIYRPMAEGVASVYARDPAVAAAGLSTDEFRRVFVALIDQESRFDPRARSPKGAQGLGQLMPETAALLGVDDATEPMANLHGAARYLTQQLGAFGRVDWALAAYNAGPHRVEEYGGVPPYRETRGYVARITAAADLAEPVASAPPPVALRAEVARATSTPFEPEQGTVLEWTN